MAAAGLRRYARGPLGPGGILGPGYRRGGDAAGRRSVGPLRHPGRVLGRARYPWGRTSLCSPTGLVGPPERP